jgi:hypothetical protein
VCRLPGPRYTFYFLLFSVPVCFRTRAALQIENEGLAQFQQALVSEALTAHSLFHHSQPYLIEAF